VGRRKNDSSIIASGVRLMEKNKGRILCVDNDQDTCGMIPPLFGQAGYEVIQA